MNDPNTMSGNEAADESLRRAEAAIAAGEQQPPPGDASQSALVPIKPVEPNPFIVGAIQGALLKGLVISKKIGWSSPAIGPIEEGGEPLMSETKWVGLVTDATAKIVAKRFPTLNDAASDEFTLLAIFVPWFVVNLVGMFMRKPNVKQETKDAVEAAGQAA